MKGSESHCVSFEYTQLLVEFGHILNNLDMLSYISIYDENFQSFLELCIPELEDCNCLLYVLYWQQNRPINFYLLKHYCFLIKFRQINRRSILRVAEC